MISTARLKRTMREIAAKKDDFTLFGLFMRAAAPGTWDLVVSAPWLEEGKLKALREFTALLAASIGEESLKQLSRVVTLSDKDPALKAVVVAFSTDDGEVDVQRPNLFGLEIEDAIIMRARRAA